MGIRGSRVRLTMRASGQAYKGQWSESAYPARECMVLFCECLGQCKLSSGLTNLRFNRASRKLPLSLPGCGWRSFTRTMAASVGGVAAGSECRGRRRFFRPCWREAPPGRKKLVLRRHGPGRVDRVRARLRDISCAEILFICTVFAWPMRNSIA